MPGMLPGMQAPTAQTHRHGAQCPAAQAWAQGCRTGLGVPAQGGGARVVGITKVPLLGAPDSMRGGQPAWGWL